LTFSYAVETLQYCHIVDRIGLQDSKIAKVIIGTSFEWIDLAAYTIGIALVIYLENVTGTKSLKKSVKASLDERKGCAQQCISAIGGRTL